MDTRASLARCRWIGALLASLLAAGPAAAVPCAHDEPPAATLLLPYFEVDLAGSATTLLSIGSTTREGTLTRVTLWSDLGVPVLWFDVYLTGWDVQTINLRDVLAGSLPRTATPFADPGDHISPQGDLSSEEDFPGCAELMPPPPLGPDLAAHVRAALTGRESPLDPGTCSGWHHGDETARGWATVDAVERCGTAPPGVEGGGDGLAAANVLWGDFLLVDPVENRASGANLVRLEAAPERFGENDRTFYSNKSGDGLDAREPLPTVWATRFLAGGIPGDVATDLIYWRDPGAPSQPFACEGSAGGFDAVVDWFPLAAPVGMHEWIIFDEEENPHVLQPCSTLCPPFHPLDFAHFPFHAGRVEVSDHGFPVPFDFGWLYFDLGREVAAQSWMGTLLQAGGRFSAAIETTPLDDPCSPGRTPPDAE